MMLLVLWGSGEPYKHRDLAVRLTSSWVDSPALKIDRGVGSLCGPLPETF